MAIHCKVTCRPAGRQVVVSARNFTAKKRGQSHILTLSLSPPPRRQQIRQTRSRPHLQPGGNPLQRHMPAGRQVVVSSRNFTASFNFDLSPFFRAASSAFVHPSLASPARTSHCVRLRHPTFDIRHSHFPSAALSACATHRQAVEPCRVSNIGRQSAICNLKSAIKRSVAPRPAWRQTTPNPGHRGWLPAGRHDSSRLSRRSSERRWMVNRTGILNA